MLNPRDEEKSGERKTMLSDDFKCFSSKAPETLHAIFN